MGAPVQQLRFVRDLAGKRVRATYHRRDPSYSYALGIPSGQAGPFDRDEVFEGVLQCWVCYLHPTRIYLWGIELEDGSIGMGFLNPDDPLIQDFSMNVPSRWDGKQNGTYEICLAEG